MDSGVRKHYKRMRLKWLMIFMILGTLIIWKGYQEKKLTKIQMEQQKEKENEADSEFRDDYQYLEDSPDIRVLLQAGNYEGIYHSEVSVSFPQGGYVLICENNHWVKHSVLKGQTIRIGIGDNFDFSIKQDTFIALVPAHEEAQLVVNSIQRNRKVCSYYGRMEISLEKAGIIAVNVLPLETYLCGVVPSEMPASYGQEALKAQAILARTYAYKYLIEPGYPEFGVHVDDSIDFQVYGNQDSNRSTSQVVADTAGILLFYKRSLAEVYYYSTSCGYGTDGTAWGGEEKEYLQGVRIGAGELQNKDGTIRGEAAEQYYLELLREEQFFRTMLQNPFVEGYEREEPWYRWSAVDIKLSSRAILERLQERYEANSDVVLTKTGNGEFVSKAVKKLGDIKKIQIEERGIGGCCKSLIIEGAENTYKVLLEYNIRYVLNGEGTTVTRADGSEIYCKMLLPSGFFFLDTVQEGKNVISCSIYGGGYGHGVGLSQNGANRMAAEGLSCDEILQKFFPETILVSYENDT